MTSGFIRYHGDLLLDSRKEIWSLMNTVNKCKTNEENTSIFSTE